VRYRYLDSNSHRHALCWCAIHHHIEKHLPNRRAENCARSGGFPAIGPQVREHVLRRQSSFVLYNSVWRALTVHYGLVRDPVPREIPLFLVDCLTVAGTFLRGSISPSSISPFSTSLFSRALT